MNSRRCLSQGNGQREGASPLGPVWKVPFLENPYGLWLLKNRVA